MTRTRPLPLLLLPLIALTAACGTETAGGSAPDRGTLEARAAAAQTRTEHVYVIEADGFELAKQSVGVLGDDGFQSTYVATGGGRITVSVDRGTVDDGSCPAIPPVSRSCEKDGPGWYRSSGAAHEYALTENGLRVQISAESSAVSRDVLRAAAGSAHRADDRELDEVLPEHTAPAGPVERGDLPPVGDGAPDNGVGAGG
ncbi:hypothetical protein [Streptomyces sp. SP18CS02]|uniref:hypothetical protein n=1 Tax=Streptomyces sp. SP18CS02 TaxID=3002531 RepID=UPI002E786D1E|nr:hypothetical protein [Streptomyces sp. SP18CS02]MEE1757315.1 hypothetical protein [Streptomyces sp. SP18CS02]